MFDFLKKNDFFKGLFPRERSGATARERLRLVLLSDHLALAPDVVDALKAELLEVISRYVDIDPNAADVTFEQRESEIAMLASVPITGVRRDRPSLPTRPRNAANGRTTGTGPTRRRRRKRTVPTPETPGTAPIAAPMLNGTIPAAEGPSQAP
jgi:cell division topological specificity factor